MNIEFIKINKSFGEVHANADISLNVQGGQIFGVLGENGAGKSTLMKILSGYIQPDSGEIILDGEVLLPTVNNVQNFYSGGFTPEMIIIGIGQSIALIPGTSRSGITTLTGMALGLEKYSAFQFSFIIGIPALLGSGIYEITKTYLETTDPSLVTASLSIVKMLPTILLTFAVGYVALLLVSKFKKKKWLTIFGVYRIIVGILILIFAI